MLPRHEGNLSFVAGSPAPWHAAFVHGGSLVLDFGGLKSQIFQNKACL